MSKITQMGTSSQHFWILDLFYRFKNRSICMSKPIVPVLWLLRMTFSFSKIQKTYNSVQICANLILVTVGQHAKFIPEECFASFSA